MAFISLICCSMQKMLFLCDAFIHYACITAIFFSQGYSLYFFLIFAHLLWFGVWGFGFCNAIGDLVYVFKK